MYTAGKNPNSRNGFKKGCKFSEEHREKLRIAHLGKKGYWKDKERPEVKTWLHTKEVIAKYTLTKTGKSCPSTRLRNLTNNPSKKGEENYRWIKDRTQLKRYNDSVKDRRSSAYADWRKQVYQRDNFACRISNADCSGRIEAHHILSWAEYPELRYKTNNGITLCHAHHPKKVAEEKRLIPTFVELVSVSKDIF